MEKTPLLLKLKLGSSTPEDNSRSPGHPSIIASNKMGDEDHGAAMSEEEVDEEDIKEEDALVAEEGHEEDIRSHSTRHSYSDEIMREKHKKSKKKKKKREKERERHKHRHHREKNEYDEDGMEIPAKKLRYDSSTSSEKGSQSALQEFLVYLLQQLEKRDIQQFFAYPVTDSIAPGYSSIIATPMDFATMREKNEKNLYTTLMQFVDDFHLICNNCMTYNQPDTVYYKSAKKLLYTGEKLLSVTNLLCLKRDLPCMSHLTESQVGFDISLDAPTSYFLDENNSSLGDSAYLDDFDTNKDMASKFEVMADDLSPEELLEQAQKASREARERLTQKKPESTLGFLRQRGDGTTTLNFLTGCEGNDPLQKEKPVSLGLVTGKLTQGSAGLHHYRDDKRHMVKPVKPLYYGAFSSFCPSYDSSFANLTKEESELVYATYGNETAVQYAESICDFSRDCDMAMHLVDQLLNLLTNQQHSQTKAFIEERKKLQEEEERVNALFCPQNKGEQQATPVESSIDVKKERVDFASLRSLKEFGIDTGFINTLEDWDKLDRQLKQSASLIESLAQEQKERLSKSVPSSVKLLLEPSSKELSLADKVTSNLISLAKQVAPGAIAPVPTVRRAMGITMTPVVPDEMEGEVRTSSQNKGNASPIDAMQNGGIGSNKDIETQLQQILSQTDGSIPIQSEVHAVG